MRKSYNVTFTAVNSDGHVSRTSITLYSHYTCIYGEDSGEGKSFFYDSILENIIAGNVTVSVSGGVKFTTADGGSLGAILNLEEPYVVMIDELSMLRTNLMARVNSSKHMFLTITRGTSFRLNYPLDGMYKIIYTTDENGNDFFEFENVSGLRKARLRDMLKPFDIIITEARRSKFEHELLNVYLDNLIAASGQNRVYSLIKKNLGKRILVVMDLCAIGSAYDMLSQVVLGREDVFFYPYDSFEKLLLDSRLVKKFGRKIYKESPFAYFSLEAFYETSLEKTTAGTVVGYKHGKPLAPIYKLKDNFNKVFVSSSGSLLGVYIYLVNKLH